MNRIVGCLVAGLLVGQGLAFGQTGDVNIVLADARAALGGEKKLAALKTFSATGRQTKVANNASQAPADYELAFELPDKFMKKEVLAMMGGAAITRTSGFNGDAPINVIDQPPAMGNVVIRMGSGPGGPGGVQTPEQEQEAQKRMLLSSRQDMARLTLGILAGSLPAYPLQFSYGGQAESPDGKADIVDVKGQDGENFAVRLFIDAKTHLPLMLSWMAKEPLVMTQTMRSGPGGAPAPAGANVVQFSAGAHGTQTGPPATPEEREKAAKEMEARLKEAQANLRTVEYRIYYGDYQDVDGVMVPLKLQRSMDGKPTDETLFEKVKINGKIDPKKFQVK